MANRSGVSFPVVGNTIAGLLDGILQAQLRNRQFKQEDAAEARKERMFSLQEQAALDAQRQRDEARFPPPPTTRGIGQAVEQTLQQKFAQADQGALEREAALQQQAAEEATAGRRFGEAAALIGLRGTEQRKTKQTPTPGTVKPVVPPTPEELAAAETKAVSGRKSRLASFRAGVRIPGLSHINPVTIDARFGPDLLDEAVAAADENPELGTGEVVQNFMAEEWAKSVVKPENEADAVQRGAFSVDDSIANDVNRFGVTDSKQHLALQGEPVTGEMLNSLLGGPVFEEGPKDLEDIAFAMLKRGKTEQDFRALVEQILITPNLEDVRSSGPAQVPGPVGAIPRVIGNILGGGNR